MERVVGEWILIDSAEEFVRLRTSDLSEEYLRAANEAAPIDVWFAVILRYPDMKEWVAHNKTIPVEVLDVLARDEMASVRAAVAEKRKLSVELFDLLARDESEMVRSRIAYNKMAPAHVLEFLSADVSPLVRQVVMRRLG